MKTKNTFALLFRGGEVQFLTRSRSATDWNTVESFVFDNPDRAAIISNFKDTYLGGSERSVRLPIFLSEPDIEVGEVSILGRSMADRNLHAARTLARLSRDRAENILVKLGPTRADSTAQVVYTKKDTLVEVQAFLDSNGFKAMYFAPAHKPHEFAEQPRFWEFVENDVELLQTSNKSLRKLYLSSMAVMALVAVSLMDRTPKNLFDMSLLAQTDMAFSSPSSLEPKYKPKAISESLQALERTQTVELDGGFVPPLTLGDLPKGFLVQDLEPVDTDGQNVASARIALNSLSASYDGSDAIALSALYQSPTSKTATLFLPTNDVVTPLNLSALQIDPPKPNYPDAKELKRLDRLLRSGLYVHVGLTVNLTMAQTAVGQDYFVRAGSFKTKK